VIVNDDLDRAVAELEAVIAAESHRPARLPTLDGEIARIGAEIDGYLAAPAAAEGR